MPNHCYDKTVGADMTAGYEFPAFFSGFRPFRQEVRKGRPVFNINWVAWILAWGILLLPCCGIAGDESAPEIMSGFSWDGTFDVTGWWVSEKLDGVRGIWTGTEMLSRSGRIIKLPGWFTRGFPDFALDGELWIGRGRFHEMAGIVQQIDAGDAGERSRIVFLMCPMIPSHLNSGSPWRRHGFRSTLPVMSVLLSRPAARATRRCQPSWTRRRRTGARA